MYNEEWIGKLFFIMPAKLVRIGFWLGNREPLKSLFENWRAEKIAILGGKKKSVL